MVDSDRPVSRGSTIDDPDLFGDITRHLAAQWPSRDDDTEPQSHVQPVSASLPSQPGPALSSSDAPVKLETRPISEPVDNNETEDDETVEGDRLAQSAPVRGEAQAPQQPGGRRSATTATYGHSSVYSGNKIKHLKKEDGIPLWRKDIQYEFLRAVFEDRTQVFSNSYEYKKDGFTFADVYIYAMAISSKTSKILRDKLMTDRKAAIHMAMVCLLVNVGRMNTTLNFFPEMRAQLRTYHSIPSLQARQDPNAYKQLQDAPRLKSILKGASEDKKEPNNIEAIMAQEGIRTNPVNLIFVLSHHAVRVSEMHFTAPREFFDLITRTTLSSKSRAKAFLWIMWWYLESNFTAEDAENNPFGPGQPSDDEDGIPRKVPLFEHLTEEQAAAENVDTTEEIAYGEQKRIERLKIMEADAAASANTPKNARKKEDRDGTPSGYDTVLEPRLPGRGRMKRAPLEAYQSDTDQTRSVSPSSFPSEKTPNAPRSGRGRWPRSQGTDRNAHNRVILKTKMAQVHDAASPFPPGSSHPVLHPETGLNGTSSLTNGVSGGGGPGGRRSRPLTAHQQAVNRNREHRVDYILDRKLRSAQRKHRRRRLREGAIWRAWTRHDAMADPFADSEDEESKAKGASGPTRMQGFGGLMPLETEADDWGEEVGGFAAAVRRAGRRLTRWDDMDEGGRGKLGVVGTKRRSRKKKEKRDWEGEGAEDEGEWFDESEEEFEEGVGPGEGEAEEVADADDMEID
ncbi:MAG: hypothetical protein M1814_004534 [Vezdaea aestivalis]|nr:MAG: hypothetical protein M1814_004534 [Vezdaea aestivalis]